MDGRAASQTVASAPWNGGDGEDFQFFNFLNLIQRNASPTWRLYISSSGLIGIKRRRSTAWVCAFAVPPLVAVAFASVTLCSFRAIRDQHYAVRHQRL